MEIPSTDRIQMDTPRPKLDVSGSTAGAKKRWTMHTVRLRTVLSIPKEEEAQIRKVLAKYRRLQTRKLGARDEDPDPYDKTYIFYCLNGRREN
jgi:hypothetical protein